MSHLRMDSALMELDFSIRRTTFTIQSAFDKLKARLLLLVRNCGTNHADISHRAVLKGKGSDARTRLDSLRNLVEQIRTFMLVKVPQVLFLQRGISPQGMPINFFVLVDKEGLLTKILLHQSHTRELLLLFIEQTRRTKTRPAQGERFNKKRRKCQCASTNTGTRRYSLCMPVCMLVWYYTRRVFNETT